MQGTSHFRAVRTLLHDSQKLIETRCHLRYVEITKKGEPG